MPALDSYREKFAALNAQVLDISADSLTSHVAWQGEEIGSINFPMCADFFPHAEVTSKFGILREGTPVAGIPERAAFIVDKAGRIVFAKIYPLDDLPKMGELLEELRKIAG